MSYILLRIACEADLQMDDSFNELTYFPVWPGGRGGCTHLLLALVIDHRPHIPFKTEHRSYS